MKRTVSETTKRKIKRRLDRRYELLDLWTHALEEILIGGDQSYTIGGRQVNRRTYSADTCREEIRRLEDEIDELEDLLEGIRPRATKRVLIRDV